jgi:hypothetical protein
VRFSENLSSTEQRETVILWALIHMCGAARERARCNRRYTARFNLHIGESALKYICPILQQFRRERRAKASSFSIPTIHHCNAEKSPQQQFEGNNTIECNLNLMRRVLYTKRVRPSPSSSQIVAMSHGCPLTESCTQRVRPSTLTSQIVVTSCHDYPLASSAPDCGCSR